MNIFKNLFYQHKGGKGVTAPPPAKGIKRFLFLSYTHFWRLIRLNLLFILFCLPVVTIPPSITAMNKVLITLAREGNVFFFKDFIDEFKSSFLKSWIAFIPWLIVIAISVMGYLSIHDVYSNALLIILWVTVCSILYCYSTYCFSMIALIDLPLGKIMKNAAIMTLTEIRRNVFMILTIPIFIISAIYCLFSIPLVLFFEFSFVGLINVMIANEAIEKRVIQPNLKAR
jgi:uncharacterized membrane protein YesL